MCVNFAGLRVGPKSSLSERVKLDFEQSPSPRELSYHSKSSADLPRRVRIQMGIGPHSCGLARTDILASLCAQTQPGWPKMAEIGQLGTERLGHLYRIKEWALDMSESTLRGSILFLGAP